MKCKVGFDSTPLDSERRPRVGCRRSCLACVAQFWKPNRGPGSCYFHWQECPWEYLECRKAQTCHLGVVLWARRVLFSGSPGSRIGAHFEGSQNSQQGPEQISDGGKSYAGLPFLLL